MFCRIPSIWPETSYERQDREHKPDEKDQDQERCPLKDLGMYFSRLFPFFGTGVAVNTKDFAKFSGIYWPYFAAGILLCIPVFYNMLVWKRRNPLVIALLAVVFWWSIYYSSISAGNPFMYFSF